MRVFVTGVNGQLGYDTALELMRRGHDVVMSGTKEAYSGLPGLLEKVPYVQILPIKLQYRFLNKLK